MSIKPIDLQTLFAKLDEVSREQALMKEQSALQQSQAARSQILRKMEEDRMVTQLPPEDEAQVIKNNVPNRKQRYKKNRSRQNKKPKNGRKVVTDPEIGRHINLSS